MENVEPIRSLLAAGGLGSAGHRGLLVTGVAIAALAILAGMLVSLIQYQWERKKRVRAAFRRNAERKGLGEEEQNLAAALAKLAGVKDPSLIFTAETAFNRGLAALAEGSGVDRRLGRGFYNTCGTCVFLTSLREKLGFHTPPDPARTTPIKLGHIAKGTSLGVLRQRSPHSFQATVTGQRNRDSELLVTAEVPLKPRIGESWVLRYPRGEALWEFNAWIAGKANGHIVLKPGGPVRWINRRRFLRVSTRKAAFVAPFPFMTGRAEMEPPRFFPATATEIGGPGVRLEVPVEVKTGDEVLVVVELGPDKVMEGLGIARHAHTGKDGKTTLAVELVGLNTTEVAELARQTNLVAAFERVASAAVNQETPAGGTAAVKAHAGTNSSSRRELAEQVA